MVDTADKPVSIVPAINLSKSMVDAMIGMVRNILSEVRDAQTREATTDDIKDTVENAKQIGLRFRIDRDDVILPAPIRKMLNQKKSIFLDVFLDNYFKNLVVEEKYFEVTLLFTKYWMPIRVPYSALRFISIGKSNIDLVPHFENEIPDITGAQKVEKTGTPGDESN